MKRVAWPTATGSTPDASGSSVPACPTRRTPVSRRTSDTIENEVTPDGLSTMRKPFIPAP